MDTCHKGSYGLGVGALDGNSLDVQKLELCIIFLGGSRVLNGLENALATELILYDEEGAFWCL